MKNKPRTEPHNAPVTEPTVNETPTVETPPVVETPVVAPPVAPPPPRVRTIERQGAQTVAYTRRLPQIRGGVCEFCGVLDGNYPKQDQYKLCEHFRGLGEMKCSYCPNSKNSVDVVLQAVLNIAEHPNDPDQLVVWCNSYGCSRKHEQRFNVSG